MTDFSFYKKVQKIKVIDHYTNGIFKCFCCEEKNIEFLTVDHINNDGSKQRKIDKKHKYIYQWLIKNKYPDGFQILCMNCNFSKGMFGSCSHKRKSVFTKTLIKKARNISQLKGEKNPKSKLTENDVKNIRKFYSCGTDIQSLSEQYPHICKATLYNVINRKTWKHIK